MMTSKGLVCENGLERRLPFGWSRVTTKASIQILLEPVFLHPSIAYRMFGAVSARLAGCGAGSALISPG